MSPVAACCSAPASFVTVSGLPKYASSAGFILALLRVAHRA
jgi:hypothetical protein